MSVDGRAGQDGTGHPEAVRARWLWWVTVLVVVVVVGLAVVVLSPAVPSPGSGGPPPLWRRDVSRVLTIASLVLLMVGAVVTGRAGMLNSLHAAQVRAVPRAQRRLAWRCVRHGQPAPPQTGEVVARFARLLVRQRLTVVALAGLGAGVLAGAVQATNPGWVAVEAGAVIAAVVVMVRALVRARAARRWLHTCAPATSGQDAG